MYARGEAVMGGEPAEEVRQGGAVRLIEWSEEVFPCSCATFPMLRSRWLPAGVKCSA